MKILSINCQTNEKTLIDIDEDEVAKLNSLDIASAWTLLRAHRDSLLAASDWTVLSDSPTSTAAWKTYRQALRDLPANTTDPFNPVWPTPPA